MGGETFVPPGEFDGYRVDAELGRGAMGRVYLGHDLALDRAVALKFIAAADPDDIARKRFLVEARAIARLSHPNVVSIYRVGEISGRPYLAYELIDGQPLSKLAEPLRWPKLLDVALGIARGLAAAHQRGVVHRDIKPANVMVSTAGDVKILDFGIAKLHGTAPDGATGTPDDVDASSPLTHQGVLIGTPLFLAPELWGGGEASPQSDVYSVGVVLRGLCAGPVASPQTATLEAADSSAAPRQPPPAADIPPALRAIIDRCLMRDPAERYPSAAELRDELEQLLPNLRAEPARAPVGILSPPTTRYARNGSINIAYQVFGSGPVDLVFVPGFVSHLELAWEEPQFAHFLSRLATFARVITFDKRGTGLSDRVGELPSIAVRMEDARAVMDAVGSERAYLFGVSEGACMAVAFAATYPQRTRGIALYGSGTSPGRTTPRELLEFAMRTIDEQWGGPAFLEQEAPSQLGNEAFAQWWARYLKMSASPGAAKLLLAANLAIDIEHMVPSLHVPMLILHREGDVLMPLAGAQALADAVPGSRLVVVPGNDHLPFTEHADVFLDEVERFVSGTHTRDVRIRSVASVVLVIEASGLGVARESMLDLIARHGGTELTSPPALVIASFEDGRRALTCAQKLMHDAGGLRALLHAGVLDLTASDGGHMVEAAAQLAPTLAAGVVHATREARDLLADNHLAFVPEGAVFEVRSPS